MNVATIEMPKAEAIAAYKEYREALRKNPNREDQAIMLGYRALAKGKAIIDLHEAMRSGGLDELGRPRLAIARADGRWANLYPAARTVDFRTDNVYPTGHARRDLTVQMAGHVISLPLSVFTGKVYDRLNQRALIPSIPPRLRPEGSLKNYHILWEAEWQDAPKDPALLRHLTGALFAILAVWDLTEVERAVLKGRLAQ